MTNVDYIHQRRNGNRIGMMILLIWTVSLVISVAPIFGWRDPNFHHRIENKQCIISQDVSYQIFATCSCFYLPLLFILLLYWRIFQVIYISNNELLVFFPFVNFIICSLKKNSCLKKKVLTNNNFYLTFKILRYFGENSFPSQESRNKFS